MGKKEKVGSFTVLALLLGLGAISCNKAPDQAAVQDTSGDPAQANLAPAAENTQYSSPAQPAPVQRAQASYPRENPNQVQPAPAYQNYDQDYDAGSDDTDYSEPAVEAAQPPPPMPEYSQPECPGENYLWTPGSWAYAPSGYYWVPGAWVVAPYVGALWTPPYWAYGGGRYHWHHGYWGQHVGFYGGVNYGYGYVGRGYEGGYWNKGDFSYNRSVNNVNTTIIHNVYNYHVTNITNVRVSYVGGQGGINMRPTASEVAVLHEPRIAPLPAQVQHMRQAEASRAQFATVNKGNPQILAAAHPLVTEYKTPAPRAVQVPGARALPPVNVNRAVAPNPPARAELPPNGRPGERPAPNGQPERRAVPEARPAAGPIPNQPAAMPRPEDRSRPAERPGQPAPTVHNPPPPVNRPAVEARPAAPPHPEERSKPVPAVHNAPPPVNRPPVEARPAAPPRTEQRPAPEPRVQPRTPPPPQIRQKAPPEPKPEQRPAPKPPAKQEPKKEEPKKNEHEPRV